MQRYNPKDIEPKWQAKWDADKTYIADLNSTKPKYIAMSMFNYPSGAGIHIGHAMNYTISDVKARFKRQQGYESYHPVGWDSFGLPAENYAIKAGVSPQASMAKIIPDYHKQYKAMGWSNDWSKEIATHEPEYYKWTQWIFSQMYKNGLAYQDSRMQWWCTLCQTVLANEQVIDGKCWRHDSENDPIVDKKEVKQWFFKITEYADELLESIDDLNWTESVKLAQKNWIGKSVGSEVEFKLDGSKSNISVFTTRPDTLFGVSFMVLAPEHELVARITTSENKVQVDEYIKQAQAKTEVQRQENKQKSGVFTGSYAINPANQAKVPIWVADYVLSGYGTGAIMAVPAHDERDHEFAQKFELPIVRVIKNGASDDDCTHEEGIMINSATYDNLPSQEAREKIVSDLSKDGLASEKVNYRMRDWSVSRQRYWGAPIPIVNCPKCGNVLVPDKDLPVVLPELTDFQPSGDGRSALARAREWLETTCPECGGKAERETDTLDTYICSSWYSYRYFDHNNSNKIFDSDIVKKWEPIDFYNGADHATAHLLYARFIARFFTKLGLVNNPEPFGKFLFNGKVTASDGSAFSKSKGNGVDPQEIIDNGYGADALRSYLMFAAPLDIGAKWDPKGVPGTHRFLSRLWSLVQEFIDLKSSEKLPESTVAHMNRISSQMIKKVTTDIENDHYNTAIAASMAALNDLYKLKVDNLSHNEEWKQVLENMIACIAPFAPHIADELWQQLGNSTTVHIDSWPQWNDNHLVSDTLTVVVQINGKVRAELSLPAGSGEVVAANAAKSNLKVAGYLEGKEIIKSIYVPGKLINFVIK